MASKFSRMFAALSVSTSLSLSLALPALAQEIQDAPVVEDTAQEEGTIVVTGSRLARDPNATAPSPIVSVSAAEFRAAGVTDPSDVLRQIPALSASGTVSDSIERGAGGIGQATLNLRGLGANRTLVLVNGQRHVSGVAGLQTVDVATIPRALIENVEVLTGGASAVYGADAVTGVVNYQLKRDYSGLEVSAQSGISERGDGLSYTFDAIWGKNFAGGRGNVTLAGSYTRAEEVKNGDREWSRGNQQATAGLTYSNPVRRFQQGDINATSTPNFFARYNEAAGRYPYGYAIPTAAQFATFFPGATPTAAEQALIDRAAQSPSNVLGRFPTFAISSGSGLIARADYSPLTLDSDGNGRPDCSDSYIGAIVFRDNFLGGCVTTNADGTVRPFRDGIVTGATNQLGGDGAPEAFDAVSLIPETERYDANLLARFEFSPAAEVFTELKYVRTNTFSQPGAPNSFYDQLYIAPDNPFIPAALRADSDDAGGLIISRDFYDLPNVQRAERDTYRAVLGLRGEVATNLRYQITGNYGRSDNANTSNSVLPDRLFAAIDVVTGPNGQPTCASNIDPTRTHPGSQYFPVITPGFFSFTPGANSGCVPANLFRGINSLSPEAASWIAQPTTTQSRIEQYVFNAELLGNTGSFFNLPGGAVQFALGVEYRKEKSRTEFDPLVLGLLPAGSPAGAEGTFVGDIDPDKQSLTFDTNTRTLNTAGEFDVKEIYGELNLPILRDQPFAYELALGGAARFSQYSSVGDTFTWSVNGAYAPIQDVRFRGTYAVAIRAPNIFELFSPQQGTVFRPIDPCNTSGIAALLASSNPDNVARGQRRQTNCTAAGAPAGYEDPLTARFPGTTGGNPDLREETAKTWTAGAVIQPRFIPGLTVSADYYSISIDDAIAAVTAQNIVNSCYEAETFPNQYCGLFDRSTSNFGFTFLRQTQLNFGRFDTSGVDMAIAYNFTAGEHRFSLRAAGNWTEKVDLFFDPANPSVIDPERGELGFPEWAGSGSATWAYRGVSLTYRLQYQAAQTLAGVEIERQDVEFGPDVVSPDYYIHDVSFSIDATDRFTFYGGVNNLTDREPFINRSAYPVSPLGRFFFVGARARF
jgi:iron complex outermembrane recepter protein